MQCESGRLWTTAARLQLEIPQSGLLLNETVEAQTTYTKGLGRPCES